MLKLTHSPLELIETPEGELLVFMPENNKTCLLPCDIAVVFTHIKEQRDCDLKRIDEETLDLAIEALKSESLIE